MCADSEDTDVHVRVAFGFVLGRKYFSSTQVKKFRMYHQYSGYCGVACPYEK